MLSSEQPPPNPKPPSETEEELKLILIFALGGTCIIFFVIIIALLVKKKVSRYCIEKRRRRRAAAAAHLMLQQNMYPSPYMGPHRTGAGAGIPTVNLNINRPYMAGPTVPNRLRTAARGVPRSNMPPPYTPFQTGTPDINGNRANDGNRTINDLDASRDNIGSDNPLFVDDEPRPHISDDDESPTTENANTVFNYNHTPRTDNLIQETSFMEEPTLSQDNSSVPTDTVLNSPSNPENESINNLFTVNSEPGSNTLTEPSTTDVTDSATDVPTTSTHTNNTGLAFDQTVVEIGSSVSGVTNPATNATNTATPANDTCATSLNTDVTVNQPVPEIDNSPVDVSTRDTIYVIEDLDLESEEASDSGQVVYL